MASSCITVGNTKLMIPIDASLVKVEMWGAGGGSGGEGQKGGDGERVMFENVRPGLQRTLTLGTGGVPGQPGTSTTFDGIIARGGVSGGRGASGTPPTGTSETPSAGDATGTLPVSSLSTGSRL